MAVPTININMDARCSQCGEKGAAPNGLCLKCVTKRITRGGIMSEIKAKVIVDKLQATVKMVEEKEDGMVVARTLVTQATIQYEGTPAKLERVLWALQAGHTVDVTFTTPQLGLDLPEEEKEPALAGKV